MEKELKIKWGGTEFVELVKGTMISEGQRTKEESHAKSCLDTVESNERILFSGQTVLDSKRSKK